MPKPLLPIRVEGRQHPLAPAFLQTPARPTQARGPLTPHLHRREGRRTERSHGGGQRDDLRPAQQESAAASTAARARGFPFSPKTLRMHPKHGFRPQNPIFTQNTENTPKTRVSIPKPDFHPKHPEYTQKTGFPCPGHRIELSKESKQGASAGKKSAEQQNHEAIAPL